MGCTRLVARNKSDLIITNTAKNWKQPERKPINLLYEREFILLNRIFFAWLSKKTKKHSKKWSLTSSQQDVWIMAVQLLSYGIRTGYKNLNVSMFLDQWEYPLDNLKESSRRSCRPDALVECDDSIMNQAVFISIKLLVYVVFSILSTLKSEENLLDPNILSKNTVTELSIGEKGQNFLKFLAKFKEYLVQNWHSFSNFSYKAGSELKTKKQKAKIYYTYRLTSQKPGSNIKQYYMGYRGCTTHPFLDNYYSSSDLVKELKRQHGSFCFKKKILGIYLTKQEALNHEVRYNETFKVDTNKAFLNKARQSTTAFFYDNTGSIQTAESNEKRSIALKGRNRFTAEGLANLIAYQTAREHSDFDREALRQAALARNTQRVICPYCGKEGQATAMRRWHFENCSQAPNPSQRIIQQREALRQRMRRFTKKDKNNTE